VGGNRAVILAADTKLHFAASAFERLGDVRWLATPEIVSRAIADADVLLIRSETRVGRELLEGTAVRFVGTATIGTDHVDLSYMQGRGIGFASAPGSNANSVAEYVLGALLECAERRSWTLAGRSLGIVGVGNVGSETLLNDPPLADATHDGRYHPLDDLMRADVVTLHVPLTRDGPYPTHHFFGTSRLRRMKEGALLVNTSRGAVVETAALRECLRGGHLDGAVLDVWEGEPAIDADLLAAAELGTPHIAGYSFDGKLNAARRLFDAISSHFGLGAVWQPPAVQPLPSSPDIVVPGALRGEEILRYVVRRCYDIRLDDRELRAVLGRPAAERAAAFRALRAGYRDRREFPSTAVHLPPHSHGIGPVLSTLGFQVKE
jgi:erythronate-4-phosphate dehydrogenase